MGLFKKINFYLTVVKLFNAVSKQQKQVDEKGTKVSKVECKLRSLHYYIMYDLSILSFLHYIRFLRYHCLISLFIFHFFLTAKASVSKQSFFDMLKKPDQQKATTSATSTQKSSSKSKEVENETVSHCLLIKVFFNFDIHFNFTIFLLKYTRLTQILILLGPF